MAILLALLSALLYGISDFIGGRASRRAAPVAIAFLGEIVMLPIALVTIPLVESSAPTTAAVLGGLAAGLTGSVAVVGLYVALARGNMTVVAPVTGVVAAIVPVTVGVALGERPGATTFVGIAVAVVAVALVGGIARSVGSRTVHLPVDRTTVLLSLAVGVGFGLLFVSLARTGDDGGIWPLLFQRCSGLPVLALAFAAQRARRAPWPGDRPALDRAVVAPGLAVGALVAGGNAAYLLSTREDLLSVVAVVVSMYPAATVALATALDRERPARSQVVGMLLAAAALTLISAG
jgi:drug/metabolite transporter (DMT)-like permease